jgi:hypothetical protein
MSPCGQNWLHRASSRIVDTFKFGPAFLFVGDENISLLQFTVEKNELQPNKSSY